jgi:hypothetical protein
MLCPDPRRVGKMKAHPRVSFDFCADCKKPLKPSGIKGFFTSRLVVWPILRADGLPDIP